MQARPPASQRTISSVLTTSNASSTSSGDGGLLLSDFFLHNAPGICLSNLYNSRANLPNGTTNGALGKYVMELAAHCVDEGLAKKDDFKILRNAGNVHAHGDRIDAASRLVEACWETMKAYEEEDKVGRKKKEKMVLGFGKRVSTYKRRIATARGMNKKCKLARPTVMIISLKDVKDLEAARQG